MDHVAAFPLPPNYFMTMEAKDIEQMKPPSLDFVNLSTFSAPIIVDGKPILISDNFKNLCDKSIVIPNDTKGKVSLLRQLKTSMFANYFQILDCLSAGDTQSINQYLEDLKKCQLHIMYILADFRRLEISRNFNDFLEKL